MKVKLLSNLQTENGNVAEGEVIDLPDDQAQHLIELGAAESNDGSVTTDVNATKAPEVETAADPLAEQTAGPSETPEEVPTPEVEEQPAPEPSTPEAPASSSTNLHLG